MQDRQLHYILCSANEDLRTHRASKFYVHNNYYVTLPSCRQTSPRALMKKIREPINHACMHASSCSSENPPIHLSDRIIAEV